MPNGTITREQLAAMLYRYAVSKGMVKAPATADLSAFADAGSVSSYAVEAMQLSLIHIFIKRFFRNVWSAQYAD